MQTNETILNIIFDAGKGSVSRNSCEGTVGKPYGNLPQPARAGYRFDGWYLGEEKILPESILEGESDVTLTAKWAKAERDKKSLKSVYARQKIAVIALSALVLVLIAVLAVTNHLVGIYYITDTWVDESGVTQTEKYTVKKQDGIYKMFNKDKELMEVTENGYTSSSDGVRYEVYVAQTSGNQYLINTSTGSFETYAVVDYDADDGEVLGGTVKNKRVMMFPRVGQDNTYSIEVTNQYGSYKFQRYTVPNSASNAKTPYSTSVVMAKMDENGEYQITMATYDAEKFASLCVSCGYMLTMQKLDFSSPETPRLPDGSVDYSAYGLSDENHPATFTITKAAYNAEGACGIATDADGNVISYTVTVGKATLSGGGYYVMVPGSKTKSVYIVNSDIAATVLQPAENMVTTTVIYPMSVSTYVMVNNFVLGKIEGEYKVPKTEEELATFVPSTTIKLATAFDFQSLDERQNTIYSSMPYRVLDSSSTFFTEVLEKTFLLNTDALGMTSGYQYNNDSVSTVMQMLYSMEFINCIKLNPSDTDFAEYGLDKDCYFLSFQYNVNVADSSKPAQYVTNVLRIQEKDGHWYIYSQLFNLIAEVDRYYVDFLNWEPVKWYDSDFFQSNISYVKDMTLEWYENGTSTDKFSFTLDNSASMEESKKDNTATSKQLKVYCDRYNGNSSHLLDYEILESYVTDAGKTKNNTYTAVDNFRRLYTHLLYYTTEGEVNEAEFMQTKGMSTADYISDASKLTGMIDYSWEDTASVIGGRSEQRDSNGKILKDADGNTLYGDPIYEENNKGHYIIRFYQYTDRKMLLTIESVAPGATPDASNTVALFYVNSEYWGIINTYAHQLVEFDPDNALASLIPSAF